MITVFWSSLGPLAGKAWKCALALFEEFETLAKHLVGSGGAAGWGGGGGRGQKIPAAIRFRQVNPAPRVIRRIHPGGLEPNPQNRKRPFLCPECPKLLAEALNLSAAQSRFRV